MRNKLLDAARDLFTLKGYEGVSMRRLAREADTTPAMIHYYFGDKHGLYRTLLEEILSPTLSHLEGIMSGDAGDVTIENFMEAYVRVFREHPWLPPLIFREMLDGGEAFRQQFAERIGSRILPILAGAIERERAQGKIRDDLDTSMTLISVMSLCVYPFLARPLIESNLGRLVDDSFVEQWLAHARRLFYEGVSS
ncbi:MAG: TetR/AcrR family transcriptional regulator [Gammaproteobacteria bacterium]